MAELEPGYEDYGTAYRGDGGRDPDLEPSLNAYIGFRNGVRAFLGGMKHSTPQIHRRSARVHGPDRRRRPDGDADRRDRRWTDDHADRAEGQNPGDPGGDRRSPHGARNGTRAAVPAARGAQDGGADRGHPGVAGRRQRPHRDRLTAMRVVDRGLVFDATAAPANSRSSAFTGVTRLENGDLLVSFRTGTGRDTPDGRLRIMRSRDAGRTWETLHSGLTATIDGIEGNLVAGFFTELPPDRLLGAFAWVDRSDPDALVRQPGDRRRPADAGAAGGIGDGGATWGRSATSICVRKSAAR